MFYASDNGGPVAPEIMQALLAANEGYAMPYGNDAQSAHVTAALRELFEAPEAAVHLVATGTAANALILGTWTRPWEKIFAHRTAHVEEDECGAPEFYSNGAKLHLVDGADGRMDASALDRALAATGQGNVHNSQRGPLTITQATELGTLYPLDHIAELCAIAHRYGVRCHMDGARFANALAALDCSPAEMTWKAGIDAVSFGGTKNGCMGVEAVIFFDPVASWEFELRRKRGAHLFSKHRFLAAQMEAYLRDGLWLRLAQRANEAMRYLAQGLGKLPGARLLYPAEANMAFAALPAAAHRRARDAGAQYYLSAPETALDGADDRPLDCRLVCDWSQDKAAADAFLAALRD